MDRTDPETGVTRLSHGMHPIAPLCQADKSAVATVSQTKELKKRSWGVCQERIVFRQFWTPCVFRASGHPTRIAELRRSLESAPGSSTSSLHTALFAWQ